MATTKGAFNNWAAIGRSIETIAPKVVRKTALDLEGNVKKHIVANGQVDTGFMLNSTYTVTMQRSTYKGGAQALPEISRPPDKNTASVAVAASYGWIQNYGGSHIPPRPFWEPAIADTSPGFDAAIAELQQAMQEAANEHA